MAELVSDLVAEVRSEGQFDATDAQIVRWLNRRHRTMVARSKCWRKTVDVGPSVVGVSFYALPADSLVRLEKVLIGSVPYFSVNSLDIDQAQRGVLVLGGDGTAVAGDDVGGAAGLQVYPTPGEAGLSILVTGAWLPTDFAVDGGGVISGTLRIPPEFVEGLVEGAVASGLGRLENRSDLAAPHEQVFQSACEELRVETLRRYRTAGPAQIRVKGLNA